MGSLPLMAVTILAGCVAGRGPQLFPPVPTDRRVMADGGVARGSAVGSNARYIEAVRLPKALKRKMTEVYLGTQKRFNYLDVSVLLFLGS